MKIATGQVFLTVAVATLGLQDLLTFSFQARKIVLFRSRKIEKLSRTEISSNCGYDEPLGLRRSSTLLFQPRKMRPFRSRKMNALVQSSEAETCSDRQNKRPISVSNGMNDECEQHRNTNPYRPRTASSINRKHARWSERLEELRRFRQRHGHCNVPRTFEENPALGRWVMTQRSQYKLYCDGKTSRLTKDRVEALEGLGFTWSLKIDWDEMFEELCLYKLEHGNCLVPSKFRENRRLAKWVGSQRAQYKLYLESRVSSLTRQRIEKLSKIGFVWDGTEAIWLRRLEHLRRFKEDHGHCAVPQQDGANNNLGRWVSTQRIQYKLYLKGEPSYMTKERADTLDSLDFCWDASNSVGRKADDERWYTMLDNLRIYEAYHGDFAVPRTYAKNTSLSSWVINQRTQYRKYMEGQPSTMTKERFDSLSSLGFLWSPCKGPGRPKDDDSWQSKLKELHQFKSRHGHCMVPQQHPENPSLGIWVSTQRTQYRLHMQQKQSSMTIERIQALEKAGFVWTFKSQG